MTGGDGSAQGGLRPFERLTKASIEGLRYRAEDIARSLTKSAIKEVGCVLDDVFATYVLRCEPLPGLVGHWNANLRCCQHGTGRSDKADRHHRFVTNCPMPCPFGHTAKPDVHDHLRKGISPAFKGAGCCWQARAKELRLELLNSQRLRAHFEEHPGDLALLKHDKPLARTAVPAHLKHLPAYLRDVAAMTGASSAGNAGPGGASPLLIQPHLGGLLADACHGRLVVLTGIDNCAARLLTITCLRCVGSVS